MGMARQADANAHGCGLIAVVGLLIVLLAKCGGATSTSTLPDPSATATVSVSTPGYVAARSLRCRTSPIASAGVQESLNRAEPVTIVGREGDWSKLSRPGGDCYVSTAFLTDTRPEPGVSAERKGSSPSGTNQALGIAAMSGASTYSARRAVSHHARSTGRSGRSSRRSKRNYGYDYGRGCPCSGGTVCIGPRGGRYCITSGGNKRYGV